MAAIVFRNPRTHLSRNLIRLFSSSSTPQDKSSSSYRIARRSIRAESDGNKITEIFLQPTYRPRHYQDRNLFSISVKKLAKLNRFDLIESILEIHKETNWLKNEVYWIPIIKAYSNSQMLDQSIRIFEQMEGMCVRTEKSLCAILNACLENRRFDFVHQFFESVVGAKTGMFPGTAAFNIVMKAFIAENDLDSARELLRKMENEKGLAKPFVSSYNVMLAGYLENKEDSKFDELYEEFTKKIEPNLASYNLRITRLCKSKECIMARKVLDEMKSKGVKPNVTSFNILIDGFCKIGDFDSAKSVLERMCLEGDEYVSPNSNSYFTLIRYLVKEGEFELALELCKESLQRKWVLPFTLMEDLVKGLVKISKENEAKEIVEIMKKKLRPSALDAWTKVEVLLSLQ